VERPQQREDDRPWRRRRGGACLAGQEGDRRQPRLLNSSPRWWGAACACGRPALSGCTDPPGSGDKMIDGVSPECAAAQFWRPSTNQPWRQGARGRWPQHICLPVGRARTSHLGQATAATGRSSTGTSAASPRHQGVAHPPGELACHRQSLSQARLPPHLWWTRAPVQVPPMADLRERRRLEQRPSSHHQRTDPAAAIPELQLDSTAGVVQPSSTMRSCSSSVVSSKASAIHPGTRPRPCP
jgi:hypothetical protein